MRLDVSYTPYATSSREQYENIITFTQFEEGGLWSETRNILSETCDNTERGKISDKDSTLISLISEEDVHVMSSGDESEDEPMSTDMLEDIWDSIQSNTSRNRREARYKICDHIKQGQV